MQNALYPQPADKLDDACPYCGSRDLANSDLGCPTAQQCSVEVTCNDCGRKHHINYTATSITLETGDVAPQLIDYHLPLAILHDQGVDDPGEAPKTPVAISAGPDGLMVMAHGYGDATSSPGYGCPIVIEQYRGQLRLLVWDDIRSEEPQIIDLGFAKETEREVDEAFPYCAARYDREGVRIEEQHFDNLNEAVQYANEHLTGIPGHEAAVYDRLHNNTVVWDSKAQRERT